MKCDLFFILLLIICICRDALTVKLLNIDVPEVYVIDDEDPEAITLDCNYDLEGYSASLVVKWLKDEIPIYQWIKGFNPTAYPSSRSLIEEGFQINDQPFHKYRGLSLVNPSIETTGTYKCIVETVNSTHWLQKKLQIIDVSNYTLEVSHSSVGNETHLECEVSNVYPEPSLRLWTENGDGKILSETIDKDKDGYYNASTTAIVNDLDDDDDDSDGDFKCTLYFKGFDFNITTSADSGCSTATSLIALITFMMLITMKC